MMGSKLNKEVVVTPSLENPNLIDQALLSAKSKPLQYPLRPRAKGVYPKKSSLLPTSSQLGLYSLGAVIPPIHF